MGGRGSGWKSQRAQTVEESLSINVGMFRPGEIPSAGFSIGYFSWNGRNEQPIAGLGYTLYRRDGRAVVRFESAELGFSIDVRFSASRPSFGGVRWWFECPALSSAGGCGRRTSTLYLPLPQKRIACRVCHRLTYESVQRHDPRVSFLRKHPEEALALLRRHPNDFSKLFLVLRSFGVLNARRNRN